MLLIHDDKSDGIAISAVYVVVPQDVWDIDVINKTSLSVTVTSVVPCGWLL